MDYSLLLAIETLDQRPQRKSSVHQIGNARQSMESHKRSDQFLELYSAEQLSCDTSISLNPNEKVFEEQESAKDVGELMSRRHCFIKGRRVYHIAIIDYL
mmetsp:Transcript_16899/g.21385  ORF Transcript_16899/g.21385 Transcript_16899/m.21385 type:complete len:100 (-) Transcript_16899:143-442(-)